MNLLPWKGVVVKINFSYTICTFISSSQADPHHCTRLQPSFICTFNASFEPTANSFLRTPSVSFGPLRLPICLVCHLGLAFHPILTFLSLFTSVAIHVKKNDHSIDTPSPHYPCRTALFVVVIPWPHDVTLKAHTFGTGHKIDFFRTLVWRKVWFRQPTEVPKCTAKLNAVSLRYVLCTVKRESLVQMFQNNWSEKKSLQLFTEF